ncbi:MAG: hypothetical protein GTO18_00235 [Anaerolineales bacterium]|nr:hypothetical protein [Anaerolineales bacterium]
MKSKTSFLIALATIGFTSTISQLVLMRELVATFYGNELLYGLILAVWLAWVAIGAWGLALTLEQRMNRKGFILGIVIIGVLLPLQITFVRSAPTLLGVPSGAFVEFWPMVGVIIASLAPICLLSGLLFTTGARLAIDQGFSGGQAYVWESVGALVGGLLFSFLLLRWVNPYQSAFLATTLSLSVAGYLSLRDTPGPARAGITLLSFIVILAIAFTLGEQINTETLRRQWDDLAYAGDSPYGRLTILARNGQRVFFQNGSLAFETQGTFPEEVIHFPLLLHPEPARVLLIGGGIGGDLRELLKHPIREVVYVEIDPLLISAALSHLPAQEAAVLRDPRVSLILTDGRLFVGQLREAIHSGSETPFDVIILDLPEPSTGTLNRFYTEEFFTEVRDILQPAGIFSLGLPSAENYLSPELVRRNGSVYHTLNSIFNEALVLPGEHNFFITSNQSLPQEPGVLSNRLIQRGIDTQWVTPAYIEYIFTTDRFDGLRTLLEETRGVRLNRDLTPICYYYDLTLWLSRIYPGLRNVFEGASLINLWWIALPLGLAIAITRWRRNWAIPVAIAALGFILMTLEVVILLSFQVLHGSLFASVSLIVTAFMAGLALGGVIGNRVLTLWKNSPQKSTKITFIVVQGIVVIFIGLILLLLTLNTPIPAFVFPVLALSTGIFGGLVFPLAVALYPIEAKHGVGVIYGTDLVGGCLGALMSAVILVPLLGIPQTCVAIVLLGLAGILIML